MSVVKKVAGSTTGLTPNDGRTPIASHRRGYFTGDFSTIEDLVVSFTNCKNQFEMGEMTRLVFRADVPLELLEALLADGLISPCIETAYIVPDNPEMVHLFLGYNKEERSLSLEMLKNAKSELSELLKKNTFQPEVLLDKVNTMTQEGYRFIISPNEDQLYSLRGDTFGWSQDSIQEHVKNKVPTMVLLGANSNAVAACTLDGRESTEWFSALGFRGQKRMDAFLYVAHAYFMQTYPDKSFLFAEVWRRSLPLALRIGFHVPEHWNIHPYHVAIHGIESDPAAPEGYEDMRHFVTALFDGYSPQDISDVLSAANLQ